VWPSVGDAQLTQPWEGICIARKPPQKHKSIKIFRWYPAICFWVRGRDVCSPMPTAPLPLSIGWLSVRFRNTEINSRLR
jgi:hypothetical protein